MLALPEYCRAGSTTLVGIETMTVVPLTAAATDPITHHSGAALNLSDPNADLLTFGSLLATLPILKKK